MKSSLIIKTEKPTFNDTTNINIKQWGQIRLEKLPKELETSRLKQEKPVLIDQPLLPAMLSPDLHKTSKTNNPNNFTTPIKK